jgi:hypothetical protein
MIGNEQEKRPQMRGSACGRSLPTNQYSRLSITVKRFSFADEKVFDPTPYNPVGGCGERNPLPTASQRRPT